MKFYEKPMTILEKGDVFVFGSNKYGFHGAGAAAFASFGDFNAKWREFSYDKKPNGWKGLYNIKGVSEGFQIGSKGWSYAIPTVIKPGARRSIPLKDIENSIKSFYSFTMAESQWKFYVAQGASMGFNGYSGEEMAVAFSCVKIPDNIYFLKSFYELILNVKNFS